MTFNGAQFLTTVVSASKIPTYKTDQGDLCPEIAVIGRSNVGKSSLLNHLFNRKGLVKTSSVPGKTRALNFFQTSSNVVFVDLPGYGYAKLTDSNRRDWGPLIQEYLQRRQQLKATLLLLDSRRSPSELDRGLFEWLMRLGKPVIIVVTKTDKLGKTKAQAAVNAIAKELGAGSCPVISYSVNEGDGRKNLQKTINNYLMDGDHGPAE